MNDVLRAAVCLLLLGSSAFAQAPLTLHDAAAEAIARNAALASTEASAGVARAAVAEARAAWLPRIDVTHTVARGNNPVFVFGSLLEQGRFGSENFDPAFLNDPSPLTNQRLAINARFAVFDQLRRLHGTTIAGNTLAQSNDAAEEARQRLRVETIARFYGLTIAEERRRVAEAAVESAESATEAIRSKFEQGLLVESDLLSSEVQLASFRQQLVEAEADIANARAALNLVVGRSASADIAIAGALPDRPARETSLEEALAAARERRGAVRAAAATADTARRRVAVARGALLPRLDAFGTWGSSGRAFADRNSDHTVGVIATFDLFDPSRIVRVRAARAEAAVAEAETRAARDRVDLEVIGAWNRVRSARARVLLAATATRQAASAERIVGDRYANGLTTITERLRAQTASVRAQLDLLSARYDVIVGEAELLRATGGLLDVDGF